MSAAGAAGQIQRLLQDTQKKLLLSQPSPALSAYDYFRQSLLREYKVQETSENSIKIDAIVRQAWDGLRPNERTPFEQHAAADRKRFDDEQAIFEDMQVQYSRLKELARAQGVELPPSIEDRQHERRQQQQQQQQQVASPRHRPQAAAQPSQALAAQPPAQRVAQLQRQLRDLQQQLQQQVAQAAAVAAQLPALLQPIYLEQQRQALQASFSRQRDALEAQLQEAYRQQALAALSAAALQAPPAPQQQAAWQARQGQQQQQQQQQAMTRTLPKQAPEHEQHLGAPLAAELPPGVPETIDIVCAGSHGTMWVLQQQVSCHCSDCEELPPEKRLFSCPQWELHVGSTSSKKWKASFKVRPGGAPGVPRDGNGIQVGRWLEMNNVNFSRPPTGRLPVDPSRHREVSAKPPLPEKTYTSERILRMQRQRELDRQQQQQEEEEEEGQQGRRSGAVAQQRSGSLDDALAGRPMKSPPEEKKPAVQLGRRLPGGRNTRGSTHRWASGVAYRSLMAGHDGSRRPPEARTLGQHSGTSKPWNAVLEGNYQPLNVRYSGERCCVCDIDSDFDFDQMVTCDCCGIAVHQSCYGIMELPGPDEMWLCRACELREDGKPPPQCCVCPVAGGALKPTSMRGLWCHSACLQWIPELTVADVELQEPVEGVRAIPRERWDLLCSVCRQRMGAKIQCESCFTAYHPLCGRVAGYHMEIRDGPEGPDGPVLYISYCARHARPQPHLSGARLVSASEEQGDLPEEQGADALCNGQPYELPDCAPLPGCPAGAARAMPVDRWQRQQHGTGTGASSVAAFWIPGPKEVAEMPRKRQRAAGRSGLQPYPAAGGGGSGNSDDEDDQKAGGSKQPPDELARMGASGGGRGRAQWGNRGAPVRGRRRGGRVGRSWNADLPTEPVDLLPLPEGVSEQMTVWCNGHRAQLNVRTQTILYHGQTISVTRFEALSGREVAKKWKQSLYSVGPDGEPEQMMQDWLEEHDLDRRALEELARNAAQVAAWKELVAAQVGEVVANMVDAVEDGGESRALTGAADSATPGVAGASSAAPGTSSAQHQSLGADSDGENEQQSGMAVAQAAAGKAGKLPLNGKQLLGQRAAGPQPVEVEQEARDEPDGGQTEAQQQVNASAQRQQGGDAELAATKGADVRRGTAAACSPGGPASALGRSGSTRSLLGQKRAREEQGAGPAGSEASGGDGPSSSRPHLTSAGASGQNGRMRRTNSLASVDARVADAADPEADPSGTGAAGPTAETTAGADLARGQPGLGRPRAGRHPLCVDVVCGGMRAVFDARTTMVTLPDGRELSPIEYEKLSGRSASKKWKWSIRVDAGGGVPGPTLEDWLTLHGLEDAVAPRARPSMLASISHQQEQQGGQAGGDGASFRGTMHREGCQCIICKNARRSGRTWAGMQRSTSALSLDAGGAGSADTVPDAPGTTAVAAGKGCASSGKAGDQARPQQQQQQAEEQQGQQLEQSRGGSEQRMDDEEGGPRVREGKRAYLRALPQLATAGATPLELHSVPLSRCWTPEDWAAHRLRQAARAAAHEAGDGGALRAADLPPLVAGGGVAAVDSLAPRVSLGPGVAEGRPASLKEKLDACNATEHARIAFGKSGVHGWGLFARLPMAQDSMVAEYRGVLVRSSVAGPREARYRAAGRDCYLFNLDDLHVLDATEAGAITRFTNHSCAPSLYTKILNVDGRQRLVFFARHDIAVGQELTYNYRFEPEEGEARLPCSCGAPSCSGFLN